jgi:hypothetical protein
MKRSIFIVGMLLISYCMYAQTGTTSWACVSLADAEMVMGQPTNLVENKSETKNGILQFRCTYATNDADNKTGKRGYLYYQAAEFPSVEQAHDTLAKYDSSNKSSLGWINVSGIGDEAITHTDKSNFHLVIIRKQNKMLVMKVNKVTGLTAPLETLLSVGRRITSTM